jgi:cobalt-zinc-cadmium resistance protein CzcA
MSKKTMRFLIRNKFFLGLLLVLFFSYPDIAQTVNKTDSTIIELTLNQFLDSAMTNHPEIKNAIIDMEFSKINKNNIFDIKSTEITFRRGQLYSALTDQNLNIIQNFGSPLTPFAMSEFADKSIELNKIKADLVRKQISVKVKSAYFQYVFEVNRLNVLNDQKELFSDLLEISNQHYKTGENDLLEKTMLETKYAELQSEVDQTGNNLFLSANKLAKETFIKESTIPADTILSMYEIRGNNDTANRFPAIILNNYYRYKFESARANLRVENSKLFPEITAGYFNESINKENGFSGWQVGVVIPLWFFNQNQKRTEARVDQLKSFNEKEYQKFYIDKTIENLLVELNKLFERLNFFYDFAFNHADTLEKEAIIQYKAGTIKYPELIQSITMAYNIRLDYLETLNRYNQTAIELEFYTY